MFRCNGGFETSQNCPISAYEEFRKVLPNFSARPRILALVCQVFVKWKARVSPDEYFGHHRERDIVFASTELLDLWI
jgi:hypothetical protein